MKRKHRKRALDDLLSQLDDRDFDVRENALFQLSLILERSNPSIDVAEIPEYHAENLTRETLRLRLSHEEQTAVGARLAQLAARNRASRSTAIWTLSKLNKEIGISLLSGVLLSSGETFDNDAAVQACDALRNWLSPSLEALDDPLDSSVLSGLLPVLRQWSERDNDNLRRNSEQVIRLLQR